MAIAEYLMADLRFEGNTGFYPMRFFSQKDAKAHLSDGAIADLKHPFTSLVKMTFQLHIRIVVVRSTADGKELLTHDGLWCRFRHKRDCHMTLAETLKKPICRYAYSLDQAVQVLSKDYSEHQKNWAIYCPGSDFPIEASHEWKSLSKA